MMDPLSQDDIMMDMQTDVPKVTVLLATFNGASFLEEQLTSLSLQQNVSVEVFVNDDGSTDGTMQILETWRDKGVVASISESKGLGSTKAFLKLLQECNEKPYVAFCDQDDIWAPIKLAMQIELCEAKIPILVFSRRTYFDLSGKRVGIAPSLKKGPRFGNALIENIAPGNTVLLNYPAIKIINSYILPDIVHFDSWMYLLISAFGNCKYINEPLVQYRIHGDNQVGLRKFNINKFESSALEYLHQAAYLANESKCALTDTDHSTLSNFVSVLHLKGKVLKTTAILKTKFDRQRFVDKIGFKIIFLLLVCKGKI